MKIALGSPRIATSIDDGLEKISRLMQQALQQQAQIICFPEAYLPGLRGLDFDVPDFSQQDHDRALNDVADLSRRFHLASIVCMERPTPQGSQIAAYVHDQQGKLLGLQTKNQLDPSEDQNYIPGNTRQLFEINGLKFGIAICHEGWRYPETVRWAAVRGAHIVFHPQHTGTEQVGRLLTQWGAVDNPYYEKAIMMRSRENTIYFASVNYALRYQEAATSLIAPSGECLAYLPYGEEGVLVQEIDIALATGLLAKRFAPERYGES